MNENEMMEQNEMPAQPEQAKKSGAGKIIGAIVIGFLLIALFYVIQIAVTVVGAVVVMVQELGKNGGDVTAASNAMAAAIQSPDMLTFLTMVSTAFSTLAFALWYRFGRAKHYTMEKFRALKDRMCHVRTLALVILAGMSIYLINICAIQVMNMIMPGQVEEYMELMGAISGGNQWVLFLAVGILAPIGEECLFRGLILQKFQKVMPIGAAIVVQAVMFGIFHGNLIQGIYVVLLGVAAGYAAYKLKSVIPAILIHMVNNCMSFVMSAIPEKITDGPVFLIVLLVVVLAAFFCTWKFVKGVEVTQKETEASMQE